MDITPQNIIYHELIGLPVEVVSASYAMRGLVVDETRNMLVIHDGKDKMVPKSCCEFIFTLPDGKRVKVRGDLLLSRPENRIPKRKKR